MEQPERQAFNQMLRSLERLESTFKLYLGLERKRTARESVFDNNSFKDIFGGL